MYLNPHSSGAMQPSLCRQQRAMLWDGLSLEVAQPKCKSSPAVTPKAVLISPCPCEGAKEIWCLQGERKEKRGKMEARKLISHGHVRLSACPTASDEASSWGKTKHQ